MKTHDGSIVVYCTKCQQPIFSEIANWVPGKWVHELVRIEEWMNYNITGDRVGDLQVPIKFECINTARPTK